MQYLHDGIKTLSIDIDNDSLFPGTLRMAAYIMLVDLKHKCPNFTRLTLCHITITLRYRRAALKQNVISVLDEVDCSCAT
jgi:hypothetical protein